MNKIGISDIAFYLPAMSIDLSRIVDLRGGSDAAMRRRLERAVESTGQKAIRFPRPWEDTVSMAATAAQRLLDRMGEGLAQGLRYIVAGTETSVDFSKPLSSWVHGMLGQSGHPLPEHLATFQVQHACASGTLGLISAAGLLQSTGRPGEGALVLCSDIARYECPSSAEITQGAGAAALLVDQEARLVELDLKTMGFASQNVDDFFRPLDSITARVKGQYSMKCYHLAAESAFLDFCQRSGQEPRAALDSHDFLVFHTPFVRMAYTAARHLLTAFGGVAETDVDHTLQERGFFEPLELTARSGNTYSASVWINLASTLRHQWKKYGKDLAGKKILISSYGSGNVMAVISATVSPRAMEVIESWNMEEQEGIAHPSSLEEYLDWIGRDHACSPASGPEAIPPGGLHYLTGIREDGFREYAFKEQS